nr:immunoglobulin heavy chain junction region [Macaca mulatta]MOX06822.1 immunoglobulin heavy chain junction region [Macaca mulatta]
CARVSLRGDCGAPYCSHYFDYW